MKKQTQKPNYKAWSVEVNDFPGDGSKEEKLKFLLKFGVLAPSVHNTQPWVYEFESDKLVIKNNFRVSLVEADKGNYFQWFAIGMLIENIDQAASNYGYKIVVNKDKDSEITLELLEDNSRTPLSFSAILSRKSDKRIYKNQEISPQIINSLKSINSPENVDLIVKTKVQSDYPEIINLHMKCVEKVADNKLFIRELAGWTRSNITKAYDGMPGFVMGMPLLQSMLSSKILTKKPEVFKKVIPKEKMLIDSASGVLIICVKNKNTEQMIDAGIYAERLWLDIIRNSMVGHPMTALVHSIEDAEKLKNVLNIDTNPVFFMRIGYPVDENALNTPRRPV